jgi:hypothetical protein
MVMPKGDILMSTTTSVNPEFLTWHMLETLNLQKEILAKASEQNEILKRIATSLDIISRKGSK